MSYLPEDRPMVNCGSELRAQAIRAINKRSKTRFVLDDVAWYATAVINLAPTNFCPVQWSVGYLSDAKLQTFLEKYNDRVYSEVYASAMCELITDNTNHGLVTVKERLIQMDAKELSTYVMDATKKVFPGTEDDEDEMTENCLAVIRIFERHLINMSSTVAAGKNINTFHEKLREACKILNPQKVCVAMPQGTTLKTVGPVDETKNNGGSTNGDKPVSQKRTKSSAGKAPADMAKGDKHDEGWDSLSIEVLDKKRPMMVGEKLIVTLPCGNEGFVGFGVELGDLGKNTLDGLAAVDRSAPINVEELARVNGLSMKDAKILAKDFAESFNIDHGAKPIDFTYTTMTVYDSMMDRNSGQAQALVGATQRQIANRDPASIQLQMQNGMKQEVQMGAFNRKSVRDGNTSGMGTHIFCLEQMQNPNPTFVHDGRTYNSVEGIFALQLSASVVEKQTHESDSRVNAHYNRVHLAKGHLSFEKLRPTRGLRMLTMMGYGAYSPPGTVPATLALPEVHYSAQVGTAFAGSELQTFGQMMMTTNDKSLSKAALQKVQVVKGDFLDSPFSASNSGGTILNLNRIGDIDLRDAAYCVDLSHNDVVQNRNRELSDLFVKFENKLKVWIKKNHNEMDVPDQCLQFWASAVIYYINVLMGGGRVCDDYTEEKFTRMWDQMIQTRAVEAGKATRHNKVFYGNPLYSATESNFAEEMRPRMTVALGVLLDAYLEAFHNNFVTARRTIPVILDVVELEHMTTLDGCKRVVRVLRVAKTNMTPAMLVPGPMMDMYNSINKISWEDVNKFRFDVNYTAQIPEVKGVFNELMKDDAAYRAFISLVPDEVTQRPTKVAKNNTGGSSSTDTMQVDPDSAM